MKIVQFKDGRYGIRRWSLIGYKYLGKDIKEDFWWSIPRVLPYYAAIELGN